MNHQILSALAVICLVVGAWACGGWYGSVIQARKNRKLLMAHLADERDVANANSDSRVAMMTESVRAYNEMKPDVEQIALFLRENYSREINLGYHGGRKLGDIVCGYLAVERDAMKLYMGLKGIQQK